MVVSDFSSDLDLFCHVIQSQAALACASCARSLGSGNRCPGVLWSRVLVLLLPCFSSLSSMTRKLINFQSCTILLVAFLGKCQVFGLKISFKKAIGSSSYSSITISSRVLLLIFMGFLSSSFLAEVSLKKNFHRRGSWRIFILHYCGWIVCNVELLQKHVRNMATLPCLNCPFHCCLFLLRNYFSDNRDTGQLSPGTTWSWVLIGSLEVSFRASLSPQ